MPQQLGLVSVVVADYDASIDFFVHRLGFTLVEDTPVPEQNKRWVVVAPPGSTGCGLLLARAVGPEQVSRVGNQTGGRVFLFLDTDDFARDFDLYKSRGVQFVRGPSNEPYGTVAVLRDNSGNLWDLIQPKPGAKLIQTGAAPSFANEAPGDLARPAAEGPMGQISQGGGAQEERRVEQPGPTTFVLGDRVRKKSGAAWQGRVVGWYSTALTPEGYAVESEAHPGSVQIYPVAALERVG
jgi:catechol 2,3-dioxygenase-like lactoylglutathione lyase family enzyme